MVGMVGSGTTIAPVPVFFPTISLFLQLVEHGAEEGVGLSGSEHLLQLRVLARVGNREFCGFDSNGVAILVDFLLDVIDCRASGGLWRALLRGGLCLRGL